MIKKILKKEGVKGTINLVEVEDKEIWRLNRKFRGKNKATDVLAFSYLPAGRQVEEDGILGDIAISLETAKRNAKRYGVTHKDEVKRLVVHGVLHLLGYKHGEKMRNAEKIYQKLSVC